MKRVLLFAIALWFSMGTAFAQNHRCGTMDYHEYLKTTDPSYESAQDQIEQMIQQRLSSDKSWKTTGTITIPVVFHILYTTNNSAQNISNARIQAQLDVLNQDFSATNVDVSNVPSVFQPFVANTGIQFCFAVRDPNGNTTDGIIRKQTSTASFGTNNAIKFDAQGGSNAWPRDSYLNIWVGNLSGGLLGYAQFPGGAANTDGVVLLNGSVGGPGALGTASPYNRGRTATHEIGHWLNLRHIWGDDNTACTGSDMVNDTPNQAGPNFGCPSFPLLDACTNTGSGVMFMNYMDYTDDNCMIMFTTGQGTRMNAAITASRPQILNSLGCVPVTAGAPVANFVASATNIPVGTSINFTDLSSGSPTSWAWTFTGGTPASSTVQNPTNITYNAVGTYPVTLIATNASGSDTETKTGYIVVTTAGGGGGCDTITNLPATFTPTILLSNNSGYVSGHNGYGDLGKAEIFTQAVPANYQVVGMLIGFGVAKNSNTTNTFNMNIWNGGGAGGGPGAVAATTTKTYANAAADVTNGNLTFAALTPTSVTAPYFAGITFTYAAGDTLAIIHTADGEINPGTAWEQFDTGTWFAFNSTSSWGVEVGMVILPILCDPNSTNEPIQDGIVIYPNPTSGQLVLHNTNNSSEPAVIRVTNMVGQVMIINNLSSFSGTHYMDLSGLANGLYSVEVVTGNTNVSYRIVLNK